MIGETIGHRRTGRLLCPSELPLFEVGLRPFFLAGATWAVVALVLWIGALAGLVEIGGAYGPLNWHGHEMVYGFAGAILAGFLLTAVPNWTGQPGLSGPGLAVMVVLWGAARVAMAAPQLLGTPASAALDLSFFAALLFVNTKQIVAGRNWRNLPVTVSPALLLLGSGLFHLEALGVSATAGLGNRIGIAVLVLLVVLIGGRIIPTFTRNWLKNTQGGGRSPIQPSRFDLVVIAGTALTLCVWLAEPVSPATAALAGVLSLLHLVRLSRWQGWRTSSEPLVLVLHAAYVWVPVSFALAALSALFPDAVPQSAALHAFTAGVVTTMMLAMMTRAALGHTGRRLAADLLTSAIYVMVFGAAAARIAASLSMSLYSPLLVLSGALWVGAFGLYLIGYGPTLCKARPSAK